MMNDQIRHTLKAIEAIEDTFLVTDTAHYATHSHNGTHTIRLWSVPRTTGALLYTVISLTQPKTILELGTSAGYSSIWLGAAASAYGGRVFTVDSSSIKHDLAIQNITKAGLTDTVTLITLPIAEALQAWDQPIDLLFLDADKKNYLAFLKQAEPYFRSGTIVVADNTQDLRTAMLPCLEYILNSPNYQAIDLELDNGLVVAIYQPS